MLMRWCIRLVLVVLSLIPLVSSKNWNLPQKKSIVLSKKPRLGTNAAITPQLFLHENLDDDKGNIIPDHSSRRRPILSRGGVSTTCDSNPILLLKLTISTITNSALLLGILAGGQKISSSVPPSALPPPLIKAISQFIVIFASSAVATIADGSLSAATNQVLMPNMVPGDPNWYAGLNRPWWEPPGWVFPIMWLIVSKPTQFVAVWRLLKVDKIPWEIVGVYCFHLALGDLWNKVFFGYQCIGLGVGVITLFWGVLLTSAFLFRTVDEVAGKFMLPTCAWVTVATCLNWSIYFRNKK